MQLRAVTAALVLLAGCTSVQSSPSPTASLQPTASAAISAAASSDEAGLVAIVVNGVKRPFLLVEPPPGGGPSPLLIALHPFGGTAREFLTTTRLAQLATSDRVTVVFPEGTEGSWNAGSCCGEAVARHVDDVAFIRSLIQSLAEPAVLFRPIDPNRVFVTGFSNGGMLAYRLGCELSDQITAMAPVAGALLVDCQPARPTSLLALHGTADPVLPFNGGEGVAGIAVPSVMDTAARWAGFNHCQPEPIGQEFTRTAETSWTGCTAGTRVQVIAALEQGHTWFTADPIASEVIWDFFSGLATQD